MRTIQTIVVLALLGVALPALAQEQNKYALLIGIDDYTSPSLIKKELKYARADALSLEEALEGTLLDYLDELGAVSIAFEGGQHSDPGSVAHHEAILWVALVAAGCVSRRDAPDLPARVERLEIEAAAAETHPDFTIR